MAALKSIYMAGKAREKRLEATAAATAAAAAAPVAAVAAARLAGVAPAPAATAAVASASLPSAQPAPAVEQPATQQQELKEEEQQAQAQPPAKDARPPPVSAEAFAAMAIAQAQAKLTPPAKQQPAQQAASAAAAPTPAPVPAPAAGDAQEQRLDAAGALDVLAAAASSPAAAAQPAAALDPAARQAAAAGPPAVPAVSDEECIAKGVSFGGDEEALLAVLNSSKSGVYNTVYAKVGGILPTGATWGCKLQVVVVEIGGLLWRLRLLQSESQTPFRQLDTQSEACTCVCVDLQVLMMSGPEGETTAGVARRAVQYGWSTWDPTNPNIKKCRLPCVPCVDWVLGLELSMKGSCMHGTLLHAEPLPRFAHLSPRAAAPWREPPRRTTLCTLARASLRCGHSQAWWRCRGRSAVSAGP